MPGLFFGALGSRPAAAWTSLRVNARELRLDTTLENGQCFGWRRQPGDEPVWVGVLGEHVLALRQAEDDCMFRCVGGPAVVTEDAMAAAALEAAVATKLRDYFQLDQPLRPLYASWAAADPRMAAVAQAVPGMRVLRQDQKARGGKTVGLAADYLSRAVLYHHKGGARAVEGFGFGMDHCSGEASANIRTQEDRFLDYRTHLSTPSWSAST